MVRNYKRKSAKQTWSVENMRLAIESVRNGRMGYLAASKQFNVPRSTLRDRVKGKNKHVTEAEKGFGRQSAFPEELETELCSHILKLEEMLFGLSQNDVKQIAFQLAIKNNLPHPFNTENGRAGQDWLNGFLKRHTEISLRTPEATSAARARGFNRDSVSKFFELLGSLLEKYKFEPASIWNVDETNISAVQTKPSKILAHRGKKQVGALTSAERGKLITAVICMSATGNYIPPMLIWPRVRMIPILMEGTPSGSISATHPSGWMQASLFTDWFQHFLKYSHASTDKPALLILDGHSTHTRNLELLDLAKSNGVHILCLPPHCTHRLQPLDVSFMKPLSVYYDEGVRIWLRNHPGNLVGMYQIGAIFGNAFVRAATMQTAVNGFRATGITPFNPNIFQDSEFAAAEPTNFRQPMQPNEQTAESNQSNQPEGEPVQTGPQVTESQPTSEQIEEPEEINQQAVEPQQISKQVKEPQESNQQVAEQQQTSKQIQGTPHQLQQQHRGENDVARITVSPSDICPLPCAPVKSFYRKRTGSTAILTGTPYKTELEASVKSKKTVSMKVRLNMKAAHKTGTLPLAANKTTKGRKQVAGKGEAAATSVSTGRKTENKQQSKQQNESRKNTTTKRKAVRRKEMTPTTSEDENSDEKSGSENMNLCNDSDDDSIEDEENNTLPKCKAVKRLFVEKKSSSDNCVICGDFGKDNELWFRCKQCGFWAHKLCTGEDRAAKYICDDCKRDNGALVTRFRR